TGVHAVDRVAGFGLDRLDGFGDFFGRLGGAVGEFSHFIGDHSKPAAMLAGAGRFDGGVERQKIGLIGDVVDDFDDLADLFTAIAQFLDTGGRGADGLVDRFHTFY